VASSCKRLFFLVQFVERCWSLLDAGMLANASWAPLRDFKAAWAGKPRAAGGGGLTSSQRGARGDHGARVPPRFFCSAVLYPTNFFSRSAPQARYTRPARCPAAPRHDPIGIGPWQRPARQFARYGPGWRGGSSAREPSKAPRWTLAMGARAGSPRRAAPISAFSRDGTGQPVVAASSGKQDSSDGARTPPRHRPAGAIFDHTRAAAGHSGQPSPTASERGQAAWHSLGHRTGPAPHGEATAIGRYGSQVYRVSVQSRGMATYGELATSGRLREWGVRSAVMSPTISSAAAAIRYAQQACSRVPCWHAGDTTCLPVPNASTARSQSIE